MDRQHLSSRLLRCALLAVCTLLTLLAVMDSAAFAQSGCPSSTGRAGWPPNSTVYVTIDSSITEPERSEILRAIQSWNDANATNGSGVYFSTSTPPSGANILSINNGTVYSSTDASGHTTYNAAGTGTVATDVGALMHV